MEKNNQICFEIIEKKFCNYGKKVIIEKIQLYKHLLENHLDINEIYLFGSFAWGNADENSDIDVAIL